MDFPKTVNKVALIGDLHCNYNSAQKSVRQANKQGAEIIIQVGDFGYKFPDGYLNMIQTECEKFGILFLFIDGNHDDFDWLLAQPISDDGTRKLRPNLWHLPRALRWEWDGVSFMALGGAVSVDRQYRTPGFEWWPQEALSNTDMWNATKPGHVDVMITHDCPVEVPTPMGDGSWIPEEDLVLAENHRYLLQEVVDFVKPKALFHGHYHTSYSHVTEDGLYVRGLNMDGTPWNQAMAVFTIDELKALTQ